MRRAMGWALQMLGNLTLMLTMLLALSFVVVAYLLGWQIDPVLCNGMSPAFKVGDVAVMESVEAEAIELDDIIVYYSPLDGQRTAHRVIGRIERDEGFFFRTKGDNNEEEDPYIVPAENITGRAKFQIPLVGYVNYVVGTPLGIALLLGLPGLILTSTETNRLLFTLIPQERRRRRAEWATGLRRKDWIR